MKVARSNRFVSSFAGHLSHCVDEVFIFGLGGNIDGTLVRVFCCFWNYGLFLKSASSHNDIVPAISSSHDTIHLIAPVTK